MTASGTLARVVFDESHNEAWTIRPELARAMQPAHPGDSSYARAAAALAARDFVVAPNADQPLTAETLRECEVLVIAHPSDPRWERTTGSGSPRLRPEEIDAIEEFVAAGGGLVVLGETEQEKYGNNLNELLARFGLHLENDTVQDYEHHRGAPSWILADLLGGSRGCDGDLLARVNHACLYRATTITSANGAAVLARTHATASSPARPLIVAAAHGRGRVVVLADSDLFGDDCIDELDHRTLWLNICYWVARAAVGPAGRRALARDRGRPGLARAARRDRRAGLRSQPPDGSLSGDAVVAAGHVDADDRRDRGARAALPAPGRVPEGRGRGPARLGLRQAGLHRARSSAFRPELQREDGIEHLVVFPMYKQNGSRDTLLRGADRARAVARLDRRARAHALRQREVRARSSWSTPPPATTANARCCSRRRCVAGGRRSTLRRDLLRPRGRAASARVGGAAADLLRLNLPPDAALLLASPAISQQAYVLWDLIHDRAHSHGDLPFDPFMIRQRDAVLDVLARGAALRPDRVREAVDARGGGHAFARYVQYAILFDRLFRFPITGPRVRNYDGLGGQLLFAYLHRHGVLHWTDNRLTIEWEQVAAGVASLRDEVEELYRLGIDRTKLQHWAAAHDLVAASRGTGVGLALGCLGPRLHRRRGPAAVRRPGPRGRVPALDLLFVVEG